MNTIKTIRKLEIMNTKPMQDCATDIARVLTDGKAGNVAVIDVSAVSGWTDFFVIGTITSAAHSGGLYRQVRDYAGANDLRVHVPARKIPDGADWNLIDLGPVVVHLMSADARGFYELEKLWVQGKRVL
jgi:ribosome-associated protein